MPNQYDVIIVGGGMVGATCALAAAQQGLRTALIEQRQPGMEWPPASFCPRVSALTRASQQLLEQLAVWPQLERYTAYQAMQVWEADCQRAIHFQASEIGEPDLGHIVENRCLIKALWQRCATYAHLDIILDHKIIDLTLSEQSNTLFSTEHAPLTADLIVAADGANSQLRTLAHIGVSRQDYQQNALVALVRSAAPQYPTAWQRFLPTGPLALLPLGDIHFAVVWSHTPAEAARLQQQPAAAFAAQLNQASQGCVGDLHLVGERYCFPLYRQHALAYVKPGLALIGDAAHVIHPLAGQGVNLGLADVQTLLDTLQQARMQQEPLGRLRVLRRYERARKGHNQTVQQGMDFLNDLFRSKHAALRWARTVGFSMVEQSAWLRRYCAHHALGAKLTYNVN